MLAVSMFFLSISLIFFWAVIPAVILSIISYVCSGKLGANHNKHLYAKLTGIRKGVIAMLVFVCISFALNTIAVALLSAVPGSPYYTHSGYAYYSASSSSDYAYFAATTSVFPICSLIVMIMCIVALIVSGNVRKKCVAADPTIAQPVLPQPAAPANTVYIPVQQVAAVPVSAGQSVPVQQVAAVPVSTEQSVPVQQVAPAGGSFCTACGRQLEADAKFCPGCGKSI